MGEMQMPVVGLGQMPASATMQAQIMGLRQMLASAASQGLGRARCQYLERVKCHFSVRVKCQIWGGARFPMRGTLRCWLLISWPTIALRICFQMMISRLPQGEELARKSQATQQPSAYRLTRFD